METDPRTVTHDFTGAEAPLTLIKAPPDASPPRLFSMWKETGMDGRTVRYLIRDDDGNHVGTAPTERHAADLVDLLNFAGRAEEALFPIENALSGIRDDVTAARTSRMPKTALARIDVRLDDAWKAIGRLRGQA